ncbi:hypothetical protein RHMOL_Rhmol10G0056000 [Rhododendron molle]|uniref:Uncharacterized protein n=1 Tax=Rhododendron molle TaxID=49168 RepID=A0ACC0M0T8_RHOML|nr:hypothetical protein RHMOL_Rhmol10G0056000 [Rhododendron molle]
MGEVGSTVLTCYKGLLLKGIGVKCFGVLELKGKHLPVNYPSKRQCHDQRKITLSKSRSPLVIKNQMTKPNTYSSRISTDTPLFESPEASFDEYLEDKTRMVKAIFPDKRSRQRLNEVFAFSTKPSTDFPFSVLCVCRVGKLINHNHLRDLPYRMIEWTGRVENPDAAVTIHVPDGLAGNLHETRWELQGLDNILKLSEFSLCVTGSLYPERRGARSRMKFQLQMNISSVVPPALSLVPEDVRFGVVELVLKTLAEDMKHKVNGSLLADYGEFKKEKLKAKV